MVKVKPVTYEPVSGELDGSIAMLQAAAVLDAAAFFAVESKNVGKLLDIAAMWIGVAERLGVEVEEDDDDETGEESNERRIFGFSSNSQIDEPTKEVVAEDAGD
ncbi:hypothetical protein SEA_FAUST_53 [Streptomyces phage Faust]|uniref:Uncharacterized protein n=1 Tax=Streptomyces phage Faust TaxID=2767565 RepID=A0A7G9UYQ1_9CAUD|nr:hypothetical protein PP456_gp203 [Streptomyces phage Faust]QNN99156.1 hypothetical protein SEA_FAUST_53 [Streptomyces phage Faust]